MPGGKKGGAVGAMSPAHYLSKPGGGGGLGGVAYKDRARPPPRGDIITIRYLTPPSRGPKRGRNCYVTLAFSGVPNAKRGRKIRIGSLTPAFSGVPGQKGTTWELQPRPCRFGGPKEGAIETQPLRSQGSEAPSARRKSEMAASPLPSRGSPTPSVGRKSELAVLPVPAQGSQFKRGQNQYWLPRPCLPRGPKEGAIAK